MNWTPVAVVAAGAAVALAIAGWGRFEIAAQAGGEVYRLNRWTGEVYLCMASNQARLAAHQLGMGTRYRCDPPTRAEIDAEQFEAWAKKNAP